MTDDERPLIRPTRRATNRLRRDRQADQPRPHGAQDQLIEVLDVAEDGVLKRSVRGRAAVRGAGDSRLRPSQVYGAATFYHLFELSSARRHDSCTVRTGTACFVKGADEIVHRVRPTLRRHRRGDVRGTPADEHSGRRAVRLVRSGDPVVVLDGEVLGREQPEYPTVALIEERVEGGARPMATPIDLARGGRTGAGGAEPDTRADQRRGRAQRADSPRAETSFAAMENEIEALSAGSREHPAERRRVAWACAAKVHSCGSSSAATTPRCTNWSTARSGAKSSAPTSASARRWRTTCSTTVSSLPSERDPRRPTRRRRSP